MYGRRFRSIQIQTMLHQTLSRFVQYAHGSSCSFRGHVSILKTILIKLSFPPSISGNWGRWEPWEPWSRCSSTCKRGVKVRHRVCSRSSQKAKPCKGKYVDEMECNVSGSDGCHLPGQLVRMKSLQVI